MTISGNQEPPNYLLSVDPGKVNGVSIFRDGTVESIGQVSLDNLPTYLYEFEEKAKGAAVVVIVYEGFTLYKGRALQQSGSEMEASQAIGQLKMLAAKHKWPIHKQPANIKKIAEKWGSKVPSNHTQSHQIDAYNHGVYWLVKNGMRRIETNG